VPHPVRIRPVRPGRQPRPGQQDFSQIAEAPFNPRGKAEAPSAEARGARDPLREQVGGADHEAAMAQASQGFARCFTLGQAQGAGEVGRGRLGRGGGDHGGAPYLLPGVERGTAAGGASGAAWFEWAMHG